MGLSFEECQRIIKTVQYKPSVRFEIEPAAEFEFTSRANKHARITLTYNTQDADNGIPTSISANQICSIDNFVCERDFLKFLFRIAIMKMEEHEAKEWFRVNGIPVFDPHPELKKEAAHV